MCLTGDAANGRVSLFMHHLVVTERRTGRVLSQQEVYHDLRGSLELLP